MASEGMTLDCPRCGTTYRVSGTSGSRGDAAYECAKCHEVFGPGTVADDVWRDEPDDDTFRFDDDAPARPARGRSERVRRPAAVPHDGERGPVELDEDVDEDVDEDAAADLDDKPPAKAPARRRRRAEPEEEDDDPPGVARFALRGLIAVTLTYAVVSVWASTHGERFQRLLGGIPLVGSRLAELPLDPGDVALRDVGGAYDHLKSGELVFVVRGTAVNRSPDPLRRIQVEGRVSGAEDRRQVASCTDAPIDLRKMSRQMLMLMDDVRESRPGVVPAGGSAACAVVFIDPPRPTRELSLEVIAVLAN